MLPENLASMALTETSGIFVGAFDKGFACFDPVRGSFGPITSIEAEHPPLAMNDGRVDILRFLGMGARACFIGRAYLYGLGANGQAGVTCTMEILRDEFDRSMALSGVSDAASVERGVVANPLAAQIVSGPPSNAEGFR